ncbi:hypothetical protein Anapl_12070 [Anas platyrhynchos]|uniref:Uncharacterized protein n=1 Tax=Anas platyrhynchos TaxID=8839 RepID=R0KQX8_ANAPL|nr:hypothetical protein Anapl_12070 [Anas platyrhynchos]
MVLLTFSVSSETTAVKHSTWSANAWSTCQCPEGGCPVWGTATDGTAHGVGSQRSSLYSCMSLQTYQPKLKLSAVCIVSDFPYYKVTLHVLYKRHNIRVMLDGYVETFIVNVQIKPFGDQERKYKFVSKYLRSLTVYASHNAKQQSAYKKSSSGLSDICLLSNTGCSEILPISFVVKEKN